LKRRVAFISSEVSLCFLCLCKKKGRLERERESLLVSECSYLKKKELRKRTRMKVPERFSTAERRDERREKKAKKKKAKKSATISLSERRRRRRRDNNASAFFSSSGDENTNFGARKKKSDDAF